MKSRIIRHGGKVGESRQEDDPSKSPQEDLLRLEALAKAAPVGMFHGDANGKCRYVNERWRMISGLTLEQALGDGWLEAIHPEDRKRIATEWKAVTNIGLPAMAEWRFPRPDGKITWVYGQAEPIRNAAGEVKGYVGTITNITRQKRAEQALRESEQRFQSLLDAAPDPVVAVDREGRIVLVSVQTEKLFGYTREELLGQTVEVLIPARFRDPHRRHRSEYNKHPSIRPMASIGGLLARRKDGSEFSVDINLSPLISGAEPLVMAIIRDTTERERVAVALRENEARFRGVFQQAAIGYLWWISKDGF